ncbi:MAG: zinc/manganese transport system substrate-binding protein [Planctomycetota bacterium]|jgi:zinc/manganese transport system substrate-binding protein
MTIVYIARSLSVSLRTGIAQQLLCVAVLLLSSFSATAAASVSSATKVVDPDAKIVRVVSTLGVLGYLAQVIGGEFVTVEVLADPRQDPHHVKPLPTLMKRAREADLFIEVGLQLELWAEGVAVGSGNHSIQRGQVGRCVASRNITAVDRPTSLSRELGDVHPDGNPHLWLDPVYASEMASNIADSLAAVDPEHADAYQENLEALQRRIDVALFGAELVESVGSKKLIRLAKQNKLHEWLELRGVSEMLGGWSLRAAELRGMKIVTYHKNWVYMASRFEVEIVIEIENKAGIAPSARHRDRVLEIIKKQDIPIILQANFYDRTASVYLAEAGGAVVISEPIDCGDVVNRPTYFDLIDGLLDSLLSRKK